MGIFKKYMTENNEKQLRKCFENDWAYMKDVAKKYKASEESDIKNEMWKGYKKIKQLYRDQSGFTPNKNTFCIGIN